jgi:hypothetical protein
MFQEELFGGDIVLGTRILPPLHPASHPKLKALDRLHLPVIGAVEIRLRGANVRMTHQRLNGSKVIPVIQEGRSESRNKDNGGWYPFRLDCIPF